MNEKAEQMATQLKEKSESLRGELIELEKQFNMKKDEFIKIQGALEAIQAMAQD